MNNCLQLFSLIRVVAIASVVAIIVLSTLPGSERPHVLHSGNLEHFIAYTCTALLLVVGFGHRWRAVAMLSLASALLEVAQIWIPGRSAGVDNCLASSAGALVGSLLAIAAVEAFDRSARRVGLTMGSRAEADQGTSREPKE